MYVNVCTYIRMYVCRVHPHLHVKLSTYLMFVPITAKCSWTNNHSPLCTVKLQNNSIKLKWINHLWPNITQLYIDRQHMYSHCTQYSPLYEQAQIHQNWMYLNCHRLWAHRVASACEWHPSQCFWRRGASWSHLSLTCQVVFHESRSGSLASQRLLQIFQHHQERRSSSADKMDMAWCMQVDRLYWLGYKMQLWKLH